MTTALIVSNLLLWVAVLVLAGVVLALLRQVGVLHERVAPAGALVGRERPQVGESAPVLAVADRRGTEHAIGGPDPDGASTLLFFLSPTCPVCETLLPVVRSVVRTEGPSLRLVLASDGADAEHERLVRELGLEREAYVVSTELGVAFQIGRVPYAVLIDASGVVRARGLVNTREHLESLFEARERGVDSLQTFAARRRVAAGASTEELGRKRA
jgi:methylamine dehydrogenase accessory protein MauD